MEANRFDRLSRHVGTQTSRRGMFKAAAGGSLALLGLGAVSRKAAAVSGFNGETCETSADCRTGLTCQGASRGLLGGTLAGANYGPPGATDLPLFVGSSGTCRYRDSCANEGQSCQRNDDCCNGENLECANNHCRRRN
ncbi:MAG: hypothetical protein ACRDJC_07155 [Thermomicrobiales bacterium]